MAAAGTFAIRTVVVAHRLEPPLFRVLLDVRRGVNRLLADWIAHPEESRFDSTKRSYAALRHIYPHLASGWCLIITNETSAVREAWDRSLRRARRQDPQRFERMRRATPRRRRLKASLHPNVFRYDPESGALAITVRPRYRFRIDGLSTPNPLFAKYGNASGWHFGLTLRPNDLLFHFRVPHPIDEPRGAVGVDLNFDSADLATSDGHVARVDLRPITRIQENMARKRQAIHRHNAKDLRHQRAMLRRYHRRETRRVTPLLHRVANELLCQAGPRALVLEDLTDVTQSILRRDSRRQSPELNRRLSAWTHGRLAEIVRYKARTPIIWVNPEGTSQECPRCGGQLALPTEGRVIVSEGRKRMTRQVVCRECGSLWHRDVTAAIAVLARGWSILRGATLPPSARSALLEAAMWRPSRCAPITGYPNSGLTVELMKEDDAKYGTPQRFPDRE